MRVLHVVTGQMGRGAEVFAADLIPALGSSGIDQRVALLRSPGAPHLYRVPVSILGTGPTAGARAPIDLLGLLRLRDLVQEWGPDVVQAHGGEPFKYSVAATLGRRTAVVYRRIGSVDGWLTRGGRSLAHAMLANRATRIVAVAEAMRTEMIQRFRVRPDKVVTIWNGVDPERLRSSLSPIELRRALGIGREAPLLLSIGALSWEKDPHLQLDVASRIVEQRSDVAYVMVGEGPLRADVESEIARRGLEGNVFVLGTQRNVANILAASDLVMLCSRTEGMPGCLIEAGMAGRPAVATAVGGVAEVIEQGRTGFLAESGNAPKLAALAVALIADPTLRTRLGRAARRRCMERFHIKSIAERYRELYGEVA